VAHTAWMLDGATQIGEPKLDDESDARWLVAGLDDQLRRRLEQSPASGLKQLVADATQAIADRVSGAGVTWPEVAPSCTCALVQIRDDRLVYLILGDVTVALKRQGKLQILTDDRLQQSDRVALDALAELQADGVPFDEARRRVAPIVRESRKKMNTPGAYWVLSLDPGAVDHAVMGSLGVDVGSSLLLATDGFARAVNLMSLYPTWEELFEELGHKSLADVIDRLRRTEESDPDCIRFRRLAPKDDATAALLKVE
jgi:hypothetical protein